MKIVFLIFYAGSAFSGCLMMSTSSAAPKSDAFHITGEFRFS
jgi:hypothetical protein